MNTHPNITLTAGETALVEALGASANPAAAVTAEKIRARGLPTRRVEPWHYTDLRSLLKAFPGAEGEWGAQVDLPQLIDSFVITFANGSHVEGELENLPEGISGTASNSDMALPEGVVIEADTIGDINRALSTNGVSLTVAEGAKVARPVSLVHLAAGGASQVLTHQVVVGEGSEAVFLDRNHSSLEENHQNVVTNLAVGKDAKVTWLIDQELDTATDRLAQLNVHLAEGADLQLLILNAGGRLVRQEVHVAVRGAGANLDIKGVNLIGKDAHIDVTTTLAHEEPETTSTETFRNVALADGNGVFQGQIRVAKIAQKTDARMACNTLLLSDAADFSAKPELEIFADDVQCAHGATVTDIEEDHLFYLRARGIPEREARALLVKAFVEEVFEDLDNEELAGALTARIENWLDKNG
jgi:Fe-S cluster assembly protein SufD